MSGKSRNNWYFHAVVPAEDRAAIERFKKFLRGNVVQWHADFRNPDLDKDIEQLTREIEEIQRQLTAKSNLLYFKKFRGNQFHKLLKLECFSCDFREMTEVEIGTTSPAYRCPRCQTTITVENQMLIREK